MAAERVNIGARGNWTAGRLAATPLEDNAYHQNIAVGAAAMVQAGMPEAVYETQYSSGSCYWRATGPDGEEGVMYKTVATRDGRIQVLRPVGDGPVFVYGWRDPE